MPPYHCKILNVDSAAACPTFIDEAQDGVQMIICSHSGSDLSSIETRPSQIFLLESQIDTIDDCWLRPN